MDLNAVYDNYEEAHDQGIFFAGTRIRSLSLKNKKVNRITIKSVTLTQILERTTVDITKIIDTFGYQLFGAFIYTMYVPNQVYGAEKGVIIYGSINDKPITVYRKEPLNGTLGQLQFYFDHGNVIRIPGMIGFTKYGKNDDGGGKFTIKPQYFKALKRFSEHVGVDYYTRHKLSWT